MRVGCASAAACPAGHAGSSSPAIILAEEPLHSAARHAWYSYGVNSREYCRSALLLDWRGHIVSLPPFQDRPHRRPVLSPSGARLDGNL